MQCKLKSSDICSRILTSAVSPDTSSVEWVYKETHKHTRSWAVSCRQLHDSSTYQFTDWTLTD